MLTISPRISSGTRAATSATNPPISIWLRYGVPKRGCTCANRRGSSPSSAMLKKIRLCPYSSTRITVVSPVSAPSFTSTANQPSPITSIARAIGSGTSSWSYGTIPVSTAATAI